LIHCAGALPAILRRHRFTGACLVGHSFGSFVISKVCQLYPEVVDSVVLLDPVCCMTCFPKLLYNFVYQRWPTPWEVAKGGAGIKHALRFLFSRDLVISEVGDPKSCPIPTRTLQSHGVGFFSQRNGVRNSVIQSYLDKRDLIKGDFALRGTISSFLFSNTLTNTIN
jgi:pimeloyl-ACP methyl ester carboxylesterase